MYQHSHSALVIMCLSQLLDQASNKLNFVRSLSPGTLTVHLGIFCFWKMTSYETCSGWISKSIFLEAYLVQKVTVTVSSCFGLVTFGFCTLVLECKFLVFAVFPKYFYKNTRHFYNNKAFNMFFPVSSWSSPAPSIVVVIPCPLHSSLFGQVCLQKSPRCRLWGTLRDRRTGRAETADGCHSISLRSGQEDDTVHQPVWVLKEHQQLGGV